MRTLAPAFITFIAFFAQVTPALCWWQYAEWGLSASQVASASGGRTAPCRPDVPACTRPPGGVAPSHVVDGITMVGMPASAAFAFDAGDHLSQTVVVFPGGERIVLNGVTPGAAPDLIEKLMQGVHGRPLDEQASPRVWRDARRGSDITALPVNGGMILLYRPTSTR